MRRSREPMTRREMMKTGAMAGLALTGCRTLSLRDSQPMPRRMPVGVQLYSVREAAPKDLPGVLAQLKAMGYDGVEFAGYYDKKASELYRLLEASGLRCCGTHTSLDSIRGDALKATAEFNLALGNPFLIVPWLPRQKTAQPWIDLAKEFNEIAPKARKLGVRIGYHAHAHDFHQIEGQVPWDLFFGNTTEDVIMQLDTGNCLGGGGDPAAVLQRYSGRSTTVHLKEHGGPPKAALGQGTVPWGEVLDLCERIGGTAWYIVEHESMPDSLEGVRACGDGLRALGR